MTNPAEVTEELVSAIRRAMSVLEEAAASIAGVPGPRAPEEAEDDLGGALLRVLAPEAVWTVLDQQVLGGVDPAVAQRVHDKIDALRRDVIAQVQNIPVKEELAWTLSLSYVELKSQWLQRQVRVCYEEMITGACNQEVALEASAASYLLGLIEPLLEPEHLAWIQEFFANQTKD